MYSENVLQVHANNIHMCPILEYKKCTNFHNLPVQPLSAQQSPCQDWLKLSQWLPWPPLPDPSATLLSARK